MMGHPDSRGALAPGGMAETTTASVISRLEVVLRGLDLDCHCRARLGDALSRFSALEARREARHELAVSRRQRDLIAGLVALMAEIDEIASDESDAGVFDELALLFDDVAQAAQRGAAAMRRLKNAGPRPL
ncbi:hypothetical protein [Alsobacter sp. R-9]